MKSKTNENGMLTVEATMTLIPFVLVIMGIISFINIFMVHNKIQYAMYEAANEIAAYTYFYEALGIRDGDKVFNADASENRKPIDLEINNVTDFMEKVNSFENTGEDLKTAVHNVDYAAMEENLKNMQNDASETVESGQALWDSTMALARDPKSIIRGVTYMVAQEGEKKLKSVFLQLLSKSMVANYCDTTHFIDASFLKNPCSADEYLKRNGVVDGISGLSFKQSSFLSDDNLKMIDIVVTYKIEVGFFKMFLKDPTIEVCQRVQVPAWVDGDGCEGHYDKK